MNKLHFILVCIFCWYHCLVGAQMAWPSFKHLTPNDGLNHESVKGITQDKYGYMWFAGNNGVNRFDGISMRSYKHRPGDTTSLPASIVKCIYNDRQGRLWAGCDAGLAEYDFIKGSFKVYDQTLGINKIIDDYLGNVWVATSKGLYLIDTLHRKLVMPDFVKEKTKQLTQQPISDIEADSENYLYMATAIGLGIIQPSTGIFSIINTASHPELLSSNDVQQVALDQQGRAWLSTGSVNSHLYCIDLKRNSSRKFDKLFSTGKSAIPNRILDLQCDSSGRVWVATTYSGLCLLNTSDSSFTSYANKSALPSSFASDFCAAIFRDNNGILWLAAEGSGVDFFQPDRILFHVIQSTDAQPDLLLENWGRAATEDNKGRLWLATSRGVNVMDSGRAMIKAFTNTDDQHRLLPSASVRAILFDGNKTVWVGTAEGLVSISSDFKTIRTYTAAQGMPGIFVHRLYRTRDGRILVGGNRGLYEYQPQHDRFFDYRNDPAFAPYGNYVFKSIIEDRHGNWWLGTAGRGLYLFDRKAHTVQPAFDTTRFPLLRNVHVQSLLEDHFGIIWVGTRTGLFRVGQYVDASISVKPVEGLPGEWISGILSDKQGRVWVGTGNGLAVLDNQGKLLEVFTKEEGLPTEQFNDQDALQLHNDQFLFPTRKGFVQFNPVAFNWVNKQPKVFLSKIEVLNKQFNTTVNPEELEQLNLRNHENFFSLQLNALNYLAPGASWYAYKLEGIDKEWTVTHNPHVNYTNIPGGNYVFRYKASLDLGNWNTEEKQLQVHIDTVFYKTRWFIVLIVLLVTGLLYAFYRYRLNRQKIIFHLEGKANKLEREKARVQYDSLKQQLNPHFLFNSLSSLRSLIRTRSDNATGFLDGLSNTYRYLLGSADNELVQLEDEINFVKNYVALQQVRFGDALQVQYQVAQDAMQKRIAPVTLQGLIENAIKHNMLDDEFPLIISIHADSDVLVVRNTYQPHTRVEGSNKKGLNALKQLYGYYTDRPLVVKQEGNFFIVQVPLL